jgi:site-specific recombinase XerC
VRLTSVSRVMPNRSNTMRDKSLIGPWIRRFLLEHLVAERNLARNTQRSYRDAMVMLLPFMARTTHTAVDRLTVEDFSSTWNRSAVAVELPAICVLVQFTLWQNSSVLAAPNTSLGAPRCEQFPSERRP